MGTSSRNEHDHLTSIEICAGAGGQAIGLHEAGFRHLALVEIDKDAHATLQANIASVKGWEDAQAIKADVHDFEPFSEVRALKDESIEVGDLDLLAGGVPCPPFSVAGKRLGKDDERDLFPKMLDLVDELQPRAVMIENVRGIFDFRFDAYRSSIIERLEGSGYRYCGWHLLEAHNYGVPQLRPRAVLVAIRKDVYDEAGLEADEFPWPVSMGDTRTTVLKELQSSMRDRRDELGRLFPERASEIIRAYEEWEKYLPRDTVAPTLVGGSRKHGGADLGPTRAKKAWARLGVNALGVADEPHKKANLDRDFLRPEGPMLTVRQAAIIQGFPEFWKIKGRKTAGYRQMGNAFPPPVAEAVGLAIASVLQPDMREVHLGRLSTETLGAGRPGGFNSQLELDGVSPTVPDQSLEPSPADFRADLVGAES